MERQAIHPVGKGDLTEDQEDRVGLTLMLLQDRVEKLCHEHGLRPEDFNLDLCPWAPSLPSADQP
jgi:hypothetical protein